MYRQLIAAAFVLLAVGVIAQQVQEPPILTRYNSLHITGSMMYDAVSITPIVVPGWAFVATQQAALYAMNTSNPGAAAPQFNDTTYKNYISSMGRFAADRIFTIAHHSINIYGFNATSVWNVVNFTDADMNFDIQSDFMYTYPLIVNASTRNIMYFGSYNETGGDGSYMTAMDSNGTIVWKTPTAYNTYRTVEGDVSQVTWQLNSPVVYFQAYCSTDSMYHILKVGALNGTVLADWAVSSSSFMFSVNGSLLTVATRSANFIVLNSYSGAQIASTPLNGGSGCSYVNWEPVLFLGSYMTTCDSHLFIINPTTYALTTTFTADGTIIAGTMFGSQLYLATSDQVFQLNSSNLASGNFYQPYNATSYYDTSSAPTIIDIASSPHGQLMVTTSHFVVCLTPGTFGVWAVATTYDADFKAQVAWDWSVNASRGYIASGVTSGGPGPLMSFNADSLSGNNKSFSFRYLLSGNTALSTPFVYNASGMTAIYVFESSMSIINNLGVATNQTPSSAFQSSGNYQSVISGDYLSTYVSYDEAVYNVQVSTGTTTLVSGSTLCSVIANAPLIAIGNTWWISCNDNNAGIQSFTAGSSTLTSYGTQSLTSIWPAVTSTFVVIAQDSQTLQGFVPPSTTAAWTWGSSTVYRLNTNIVPWITYVFVAGERESDYADCLFKVDTTAGAITSTTLTPCTTGASFIVVKTGGVFGANTMVFIFNSYNVTVINAATMTQVYTAQLFLTSESINFYYPTQPQVTDEGALIILTSYHTYVFNALDGTFAWSVSSSSSSVAPVSFNNYLFYTDGYRVMAADLYTGTPLGDYSYYTNYNNDIVGIVANCGGNNQTVLVGVSEATMFSVTVLPNPMKGGPFKPGTPTTPAPWTSGPTGGTWTPGPTGTWTPGPTGTWTPGPTGTWTPGPTGPTSSPTPQPTPGPAGPSVKLPPVLGRLTFATYPNSTSYAQTAPFLAGGFAFVISKTYGWSNYSLTAYTAAPKTGVLELFPVFTDFFLSSPSWFEIANGRFGVVANDTVIVYGYNATTIWRVATNQMANMKFGSVGISIYSFEGFLSTSATTATFYIAGQNLTDGNSTLFAINQDGVCQNMVRIPYSWVLSDVYVAQPPITPVHAMVIAMGTDGFHLVIVYLGNLSTAYDMSYGSSYPAPRAWGQSLTVSTATNFYLYTSSSIANVSFPYTCSVHHGPAHFAWGLYYIACDNRIYAYNANLTLVANFTGDASFVGGTVYMEGTASMTFFIGSAKSTLYILNSSNFNTGALYQFYQFQKLTDTDSNTDFMSFSFVENQNILVANFQQYALGFPIAALLNGAAPISGMISCAGLQIVGGVVWDSVNNLTWASSAMQTGDSYNGRLLASFTAATIANTSFAINFQSSGSPLTNPYVFDPVTGTSYYLTTWQLLVVNATGGYRLVSLSSYLTSYSVWDVPVIANGYICVLYGCVNIATGYVTSTPTPYSCTKTIGVSFVGGQVFVPCGGDYYTSSQPIGFSFFPGSVTYNTTYGSGTRNSYTNPLAWGNTICGVDESSYLSCYTVGNSTMMSSSSTSQWHFTVSSNLVPYMGTGVLFAGSNGTTTVGVMFNTTLGVWGVEYLNDTSLGSSPFLVLGQGPQFGYGIIYVLTTSSLTAYAMGPIGGMIMDRRPFTYFSASSPASQPYISSNGALVVTYGNTFYVYNAFTGIQAWSRTATTSIATQTANGQLFYVSPSGTKVVATDLTTGSKLAEFSYGAYNQGIRGFNVQSGPQGATVALAQSTAFETAVSWPMQGGSPAFPGGFPTVAPGVTPGTSEKSKAWIAAVAGGVLVIVILVVVLAKRKSGPDQADTDYVPMNPSVQV